MAAFVQFRGYGVGASEVEVDVKRVTHYYSISYNGNAGVELALDTGATIQVAGYSHDVRAKINAALAAKEAQS
jgi:hypothetical protein